MFTFIMKLVDSLNTFSEAGNIGIHFLIDASTCFVMEGGPFDSTCTQFILILPYYLQ